MYKTLLNIFFLLLFVLSSCKQEKQNLSPQIQWSGLNSVQVPENIRLKEFEKGNLVLNSSFEQGKHYIADTLKLSFNLPGWKKVGENVYWTNIEDKENYFPDEASAGAHAIKISKSKCDETDKQGEGIISDYIKVIPGNYTLKLSIRLKNILSNMDRFGTGVFDAINIRLFYYDKNKVLIRSSAYHPEYDREINTAFKGFNFSGNRYIDEFNWADIVARTGNFPFEEGNIPDETRYVKIFAGLKGTGEMYVDYVRYEYSSKNFTFLEQLQPYFDTLLNKSSYLLPTPQKVEIYNPIELIKTLEDDKKILPVFILPKNINKAEALIFKQFEKVLRQKGLLSPKSDNYRYRFNRNQIDSYPLVLSFGLNDLANQFSERLPINELKDKKQAYFIQKISDDNNLVFIDYTDPEGLSHAIHTLTQLIDEEHGIYHHYNITDYPDFTDRTTIIPYYTDADYSEYNNWLSILNASGFNKYIAKIQSKNVTEKQLSNLSKVMYSHFGTINKNSSYVATGIYLEDILLSETLKSLEKGSSFKDEEMHSALKMDGYKLAGIINRLNKFKPDFWVFSDRFIWDIYNQNPGNSLNYNKLSDLAYGREVFWENFNTNLKISEEIPKYLYPFFISNAELKDYGLAGQSYFDKLNTSVPKFDKILWSGAVEYPEFIDHSDLKDYRAESLVLLSKHFNMRKESCLTGSYYSLYPGRALTGSLFEGFNTEIVDIEPNILGNEFIFDLEVFSELNMIRLFSSADFLWNSSAYNSVFSSWKVLLKLYGKETAQNLILFNDAYYKLYAITIDIAKGGAYNRLNKSGDQIITDMNKYWDEITLSLAAHLNLLNELSDLKNTLISRYYQSRKLDQKLTQN